MIIEFYRRYQYDSAYYTNQAGDNSGEYVSLADYQKLEALLKRWNEIAPFLTDTVDEGLRHPDVSPELSQLIQDTSEAIK